MDTPITSVTPAIGQLWPEQGGIFIGSRLIDGTVHHVIIPGGVEHDIKGVAFSDIDSAVAKVGDLNGHSDWRAPDREDLMLGWINGREHFQQTCSWDDTIYWSRTEYKDYAWAVDFEYGLVGYYYRTNEFRVRPVRSFIASSL
ncbi:DUF1566 domain-containing protein [Bordetella bronchialis]|uniref:Lcl C-terminal domain-containing protein n=1 Tax=Bordetella bronchialis TaxID=463025 RepID=A0A193FTC6_9BORD|nr:DUF1566 domain-containing protein [Bordetella bronchialis]ANN70890.1 hypothetical protein BAU08_05685 [Bordetella bronchialis]